MSNYFSAVFKELTSQTDLINVEPAGKPRHSAKPMFPIAQILF